MKLGFSGDNGIEELVDFVIIDLKLLNLSIVKSIELKFTVNPKYDVMKIGKSMELVYDFLDENSRYEDIEIIFETIDDETIPLDECYLEIKYIKEITSKDDK